MTKLLARSAAVLDEADRMQAILEWQLFAEEQTTRLFYAEAEGVTWRPGDRSQGLITNYIRPMAEVLMSDGTMDESYAYAESSRQRPCESCDEGWYNFDGECISCGEHIPRPMSAYVEDYDRQFTNYVMADVEVTRALAEGARQTSNHINEFGQVVYRIHTQFRIRADQMSADFFNVLLGEEYNNSLQRIVSYTQPEKPSRPQVSHDPLFRSQKKLVLVERGIAESWEGEYTPKLSLRMSLLEAMRKQTPNIIMPVMAEVKAVSKNDQNNKPWEKGSINSRRRNT